VRGLTTVRACVALGAIAFAAGCGSDESARQDADEPSGTWTVDVVEAEFPTAQKLARQETLRIEVRNRDQRPVPNVAVTVEGFSRRSEQPGLADPTRPVWILDDGPRGGTTAYTNTWALGRIPPGGTKTFEWRATPVVPGTHRITYRVSAGLDGKAKARLAGGDVPQGTFDVRIDREPSQSRVDPDSGEVERDGDTTDET
jgi:hypothetical protein